MQVFALATSPRLGGNSESLLDIVIAELATAGHETTKVRLVEHQVAPCLGHEGCRSGPQCQIDDDFADIAEAAMAADVLLIAIPVYYWGVSAQLKAYIDRHVHYYNQRRYQARAIGVIIVAADDGIEETEDQVHSFLSKGGHAEIPWEQIDRLHGYAYGRTEAQNNPELVERARGLARGLLCRLQDDS